MAAAVDQVRELLEKRITEIRSDERRLQRALAQLSENGATAGRSKGGSKRSRAGRRGRGAKTKRARRGQRRDQLLAAVKDKPGAPPKELAHALGIKTPHVYALIRSAVAEKLIPKRTPATRYESSADRRDRAVACLHRESGRTIDTRAEVSA